MSYASWIRAQRDRFRVHFVEPEPCQEIPYPDKFHRYCPEHNERLNWLLCPKGHQLGSADVWIVKDEETGEVIYVCRDNDGTQQWRGFAPRH